MKRKHTLTIGIPAYNEERNISKLLENLLAQKQDNFNLEKIVIVSDGSTDSTYDKAKKFRNQRIEVFKNHERKGKAKIMNNLFSVVNSDLLVILDGDVLPDTNRFLSEIVRKFAKSDSVGLVGANTAPLNGKSFFEQVLANSHRLKNQIYVSENNSDNLYLCHGRARGFSKILYKSLTIPENAPDDAYSYIMCKKLGLQFAYTTKATVLFRSPKNLADHIKQSIRFRRGINSLTDIFNGEEVKRFYKISKKNIIHYVLLNLLDSPISLVSYSIVELYISIFKKNEKELISKWNISYSSKVL